MAGNVSELILNLGGLSPSTLRKRIGVRAREARLIAGRSQRDVADAAGISRPTVQRFESGAIVSTDVLVRIAIALHAERELADLFPLPDLRTIDDVMERQARPKRGRRT
ncbi:MAG TPA: helix-turn-helix transcriptional regulator [Candidatus Acidoferrales bacterium]|nr:helix-turn-helix transcriptional regulator [Candidatus Acidoferrales bacterium]